MEREAERCTVDFSFVHQHGNRCVGWQFRIGSGLRQRCFDDQAVRERISGLSRCFALPDKRIRSLRSCGRMRFKRMDMYMKIPSIFPRSHNIQPCWMRQALR